MTDWFIHPANWTMLAVWVAGAGGVLYYARGGGRRAAMGTIGLLKEQVAALEGKVEILTLRDAARETEMMKLQERNSQLIELVTSAGAINHLIELVNDDRALQREERHRILNAVNGMTGMLTILYDSKTGNMPRLNPGSSGGGLESS